MPSEWIRFTDQPIDDFRGLVGKVIEARVGFHIENCPGGRDRPPSRVVGLREGPGPLRGIETEGWKIVNPAWEIRLDSAA